MAFDPNEYLAEDITPSTGFDPDAYLSGGDEGSKAADDVNFALKNPILHTFGGKPTVDLIQKAGEGYDIYSGSRAVRRGVGEAIDQSQTAEGFGPAGFLKTVGSEIGRSYGKDVQAPTGKDLVRKTEMGRALPEWAQSGVGFATEAVLDPTILAPSGLATRSAKIGAEGTVLAAKQMGKGAMKAGRLGVQAADVLVPGLKESVKIPAAKAKSIADTLIRYVRPEVRDEFVKSVQVAVQNGIDPELLPSAVKYRGGQESTIGLMERVRNQGPIGEPHKLRFQEGLTQVRTAVDNKILGYTGQRKAVMNTTEAGETLRNEYNGVVDTFFKDNDITYDTAWKQVPGLELNKQAKNEIFSTINGARREAIRMSRRGATADIKAQGAALLEILDNAESVIKNGNYKQATELMRELGEVGFKRVRGVLPENAAIHRDLYKSVSKGTIDTSRTSLGARFADELEARNAGFTEFFDTQKKLGLNLNDDTIPGEALFRSAIQNGNTTQIRALKDIFKNSPDALNQLKATFLDELKNVGDEFSFARLNSSLENPKVDRVMRELFTPQEIQEFRELVQLGDDFGNPILNTSGTDRSGALRNILRSSGEAMSQDWLIEYLKSKAKLPPNVSGAVTSGTIPPGVVGRSAPTGSSTAKFVSGVAADPKQAVIDYVGNLKPTRRQVIGKATQEYALTKQDQSTEKAQRAIMQVKGTQFEPVLTEALKRGQDNFASTFYVLSNTSPEFRKLLSKDEEP